MAITFSECESAGGAPASSLIRGRLDARARPAFDDAIDPEPSSFGFVAAHEERGVVVDRFQQQAFVGNAPAFFALEGVNQGEVERQGLQLVAGPG